MQPKAIQFCVHFWKGCKEALDADFSEKIYFHSLHCVNGKTMKYENQLLTNAIRLKTIQKTLTVDFCVTKLAVSFIILGDFAWT